jgi:hypothetical protein
MNKQPIFLFSLPRSGSTLLQRILATHPEISTSSEPWLLLPFFYTLKPYGVFTEYSHSICLAAFQDFVSHLPNGEQDYYEAINRFAKTLYDKVSEKDTRYFLDKTPRYFLIIPEIARAFPEAKLIFLFRNPLQVLSSVIKSWNDGRMRLDMHHVDLFRGPHLLAQGYRDLKDRSLKVNFERLVEDPGKEVEKVFRYLDLVFDKGAIERFEEIKFQGRMGDSIGTQEYDKIDLRPLEKWKEELNTRFRKAHAMKYLERLGRENVETLGYDFNDLQQQVQQIKAVRSGFLSDRYHLFVSYLFRLLEIPLFKKKRKTRKATEDDFVYHI